MSTALDLLDTASYVAPCFTFSVTLTRLPEEDGGGTVNQPPPTVHCLEAAYPARYHLSSHEGIANDKWGSRSWMGSLITGGQDASGQMYRRNRYYDPRSGRFTQEDPIGLAGGVNLYGFAAGDPVQYSVPYGLSPDSVKFQGEPHGRTARRIWNNLRTMAGNAAASGDPQ